MQYHAEIEKSGQPVTDKLQAELIVSTIFGISVPQVRKVSESPSLAGEWLIELREERWAKDGYDQRFTQGGYSVLLIIE